ncbi:MAG: hypothetical protein AAGG48_30300 [Planctomycetota bacterium]
MDFDEGSSNGLTGFVRSLTSGAVIRIDLDANKPLSSDDLLGAQTCLREIDQVARLEAPGVAPPLDLDGAIWAARVMRFFCQMLVNRVETATELPETLKPGPKGKSAQDHWSTDLVFRAWWDLVFRAKKLAPSDPLISSLEDISANWPLAAVGTNTKCRSAKIDVVWRDDCLRRIFIDRIYRRRDSELMMDTRIEAAVRRLESQVKVD